MATSEDQVRDNIISEDKDEAKPHGMPLTLGSGGYGGEECTGPKAEQAGHCPEQQADKNTPEQG